MWDTQGARVLFVLLNPSTADEETNDPTVRRCIGFARGWGFGAVLIANLFAYRARHPNALRVVDDPVGRRNDSWIRRLSGAASLTVAAWGNHGELGSRCDVVRPLLRNVHIFGRTKAGQPRHPLYLPASARLTRI